jgi:predicted permease
LTKPNQPQSQRLSADQIEVRIWAFVVVAVTLILMFIVGALLYSVTFVTQPIKVMAPIDQAYTKMLNDIVLLIVGGIGGIMGKRAVSAVSQAVTPTKPKEESDEPK